MSPSMKNRTVSTVIPITVSLFAASLLFWGCDTGNQDDVQKEKNKERKADDKTVEAESSNAPYTTALVITSDYSAGAYAAISIENTGSVKKDINPIHSDATCHFDPLTNTPFILQRLGVDSIIELDPDDFDIVNEFSATPNSNPHGMAVVSEDRAYIARFGSTKMLLVNPFSGKVIIDTIDFSVYADDDGIPEVSDLARYGDKVFATVERLDRNDGWSPVGGGLIAVIDVESGEIVGDVALSGTRSYGEMAYSEAVKRYVIAEPGSWSDLENAGLEYFDPEDESVSGFFITEKALGGNVTKGLVVSQDKGYALVGVEGENGNDTHIIAFNPKSGQKLDTILKTEGWTYGDIALTPDGSELWVADRTVDNDGIRIFDTKTDKEKTRKPIDVGLPPSDICFTR